MTSTTAGGGAAATGATVLGSVALAALFTATFAFFVNESNAAAQDRMEVFAARNGAAARITLEILGPDVETDFASARAGWTGVGRRGFNDGVRAATAFLGRLGPDRLPAAIETWRGRYAPPPREPSFSLVSQRIQVVLGGVARTAPPVEAALETL